MGPDENPMETFEELDEQSMEIVLTNNGYIVEKGAHREGIPKGHRMGNI
jgi:hypothetical protein